MQWYSWALIGLAVVLLAAWGVVKLKQRNG